MEMFFSWLIVIGFVGISFFSLHIYFQHRKKTERVYKLTLPLYIIGCVVGFLLALLITLDNLGII